MGFVSTALRWLDRNIERAFILVAYSTMSLIIVFAVIQRYVFSTQIPWSGSVPIYLFLWVTWIGCSYNVRRRSHLCFNEVRMRMSYGAQYACMWLDAVLWLVFGGLVVYFTLEQTMLAYQNFSIVQGTDNLMQWWFYCATPVAWVLLMFRAVQNLLADARRYKNKQPFIVAIQSVGAENV
ncbi:TRAP transporter small permease [Parapusillimonas granuli]|uniref:TRAP transporter small permease protein n=1 Tax=Parapusillimonas granuli TaxID=380911 RepID=A0A853FX49_9BURK|nr:TRAP transporter small permease [Parapusillimonas granuli]MBB5216042.1 TRAP-type C4-dicarboxylate transport system permease small subunit [Parapusillimonas granuli]NYT50664.1 TRAP transporter small permease [Parapusillimonas granuli]